VTKINSFVSCTVLNFLCNFVQDLLSLSHMIVYSSASVFMSDFLKFSISSTAPFKIHKF
jgi:hypothetical protein